MILISHYIIKEIDIVFEPSLDESGQIDDLSYYHNNKDVLAQDNPRLESLPSTQKVSIESMTRNNISGNL